MTPTWIEHWDVVAAMITGLLALVWWFEASDRRRRDRDVTAVKTSFAQWSAHLGGKVDHLSDHFERSVEKVTDELRLQREEMHRAILDHESRIATLEGERRVVEAGPWPR
ncbi:MAG TPA: hypothetical protein PK435_16550 [Thermoanaerobaculaceae bacterium]|nr:hypothetical protein [Thermoanaerobaculaceae bacterium]